MINKRIFKHAHVYCGSGGFAIGFNKGSARIKSVAAEWRCIGGIDNDAGAIRDFTRLAGVPGTVRDLFALEQYVAFRGCMPPPGWREAVPTDLLLAFNNERPDALCLSGPCLPANGLVLTEHGARRIDSIRAGDLVLTHKGRYCEVLKVGTESYRGPMFQVRLNGTVDVQEFTAEHPLWRRRVIRNLSTKRKRALSAPEFVAAEDLRAGDRIGFPIEKEDSFAAERFCSLHSSRHGLSRHAATSALWFIVGVYLGDGYRRANSACVAFAIGHADGKLAARLREALAVLGIGVREEVCGSRRNVKLWAHDRDLWALLGAFGDGCTNKDIPSCLMGLSLPLVEALIDGYRSSDGSEQGRRVAKNTLQARWKIASVSLPLLRSVQRLLLRTGTFASIHHCWPGGKKQVIEGRTVNTSQRWELNVRLDPKKRTVFEFEDGAVWVRIRSIRLRSAVEPVWNLEVDEDNTFCAPMMATHNCKGFSGLTSESRSLTPKYQALNQLTIRGLFLALEAYKDDPIPVILFENVPRIATRGRAMLDQITELLHAYGYAIAETTHDCGKIGRLAQSRKRFLMIARHMEKVPPFIYEPQQHPLRAVGDVLGRMRMPGDQTSGPMHRIPRLHWKTWVRLAFITPGKDWRDLQNLRVADGVLQDYALMPERPYHNGALGVNPWDESAGVVTSNGRPASGEFSVADVRVDAAAYESQQYGVNGWEEPSGVVTSQRSPGQGKFSVADPRIDGDARSVQMGVRRMDQSAPAVTASMWAGTGPNSIADPRIDGLKHNNCFRVVRLDEPSPCVNGGTGPSAGGLAVADTRPPNGAHGGKYRVTELDESAGTVIAESGTGNGAFAVADPRPPSCPGLKRDMSSDYQTAGNYGVVPWERAAGAVSAAMSHDNSYASVADVRLPGPTDQVVAIIRSRHNTWNRPFTTLELAALQSLVEPEEQLELDGLSDSAWRERIGNMVPPDAAQAIAGVIAEALLLTSLGETFALGSTPIWVRPIAVALSVMQRKPL